MAQANAGDVMNEVLGVLQSIAATQGKAIMVYGNDDLTNKIAGLKQYPGVGLVYEGMRSLPSSGASGHVGLSAELVVSIVLVMQPETLVRADTKLLVIDLLDSIRSKMMGKVSVTGHRWKFMVEAPADFTKNMAFWVQRWAVPIQLPSHG